MLPPNVHVLALGGLDADAAASLAHEMHLRAGPPMLPSEAKQLAAACGYTPLKICVAAPAVARELVKLEVMGIAALRLPCRACSHVMPCLICATQCINMLCTQCRTPWQLPAAWIATSCC